MNKNATFLPHQPSSTEGGWLLPLRCAKTLLILQSNADCSSFFLITLATKKKNPNKQTKTNKKKQTKTKTKQTNKQTNKTYLGLGWV